MITHRESTLSLADKIVRVEYGKVEPVLREDQSRLSLEWHALQPVPA